MSLVITSRAIDAEFQNKIRNISGQNFSKCYQCGTCAGSCPMTEHITATPRMLMAFLQLGLKDKLEQANTHWVCASCHTCEVRCPRGLDIPKIMEALRQVVLRTNVDRVEPKKIEPAQIAEMPQIAMVSAFRKLTG